MCLTEVNTKKLYKGEETMFVIFAIVAFLLTCGMLITFYALCKISGIADERAGYKERR
ncbi:hypothetical protein F200043G1_22460 [[Clostridium] innocuum]